MKKTEKTKKIVQFSGMAITAITFLLCTGRIVPEFSSMAILYGVLITSLFLYTIFILWFDDVFKNIKEKQWKKISFTSWFNFVLSLIIIYLFFEGYRLTTSENSIFEFLKSAGAGL